MQNPEEADLRYKGVSGTIASDKVRLLDSKHKIDSWTMSQMA